MISMLISIVVLALVVGLLMAPLESLGWYAGWYGEGDARAQDLAAKPSSTLKISASPARAYPHYLVYLSGIGAIDPTTIPDEEYPLIQGVEASLPNTQVVSDIFPYAPANHGLTGQRVAARVWGWINQMRLKDPNSKLAMVVNIRNMFQVAVSADQRYGPFANLAVATTIRDGLVAAGYPLKSGLPVTLLGFSGGGQVAVGTAYYLKALLAAPIRVISVGGVICSDPGLERIERLWHLYGSKDSVQALGARIFPGRWPRFPNSEWNRAIAEGRISLVEIGPYNHNVKEHYFDQESRLPSGASYMQHVVDEIARLLREAGLEQGPARVAPAAPEGASIS